MAARVKYGKRVVEVAHDRAFAKWLRVAQSEFGVPGLTLKDEQLELMKAVCFGCDAAGILPTVFLVSMFRLSAL
jgi:hypothetical protein